MSEITKPVETTPVAVEETVPETKVEEPVVPAATEPVVETPATTEEVAAAADPTPAVVETPKEFTGEGVLGYKAPGGFLK